MIDNSYFTTVSSFITYLLSSVYLFKLRDCTLFDVNIYSTNVNDGDQFDHIFKNTENKHFDEH